MEQITEKTIDIDQILKSKMGSKAKWIPGFLVSWLKRTIHQDEVNAFLWRSRDKRYRVVGEHTWNIFR